MKWGRHKSEHTRRHTVQAHVRRIGQDPDSRMRRRREWREARRKGMVGG